MSINFYFDLCSLVIVITLIFADFFKHTTIGKANRLFLVELIIILSSCFFRVSYQTLLSGASYSTGLRNVAYILIYCFLITHNFIAPVGIKYLICTIGIDKKTETNNLYRIPMYIFEFAPLLIVLSNIFTKKLFFISGAMEFYENPSIHIFTLLNIATLVWGVIILIANKKSLPKVKFTLSIMLLGLNICFLTILIFLSVFKISLFIFTMSSYLILLFGQRPELHVHKETGLKSAPSFWGEIESCLKLEKRINIVFFKVTNSKNILLYIGQETYSRFIKTIAERMQFILEKYQLNKLFELYYIADSTFAIVTENGKKPQIQLVAESVKRSFSGKIQFEDFEFFPDTDCCVVNIPGDIDNLEYLKYFSKEFQRIIEKSEDPVWIREVASTDEFKMKKEIDAILSAALEGNNFEIFYQPIWGVKEQRFTSAEALLRLNDPIYGYVPPSIFIPMAESNGLIHKIGDFVFEEVCKFIASPEFESLGLEYIEINLSTAQSVESNLVDKLFQSMNVWGVSPSKVRLEITENAADFNSSAVEQNISELHDLGIKFALDDYGTGYSNIKKVTGLPLDVVKLDKAFVDKMNEPVMREIIQDTIHMLKKLNKQVLVEGIEDQNTADFFINLKIDGEPACEYIQGYFFSKPLPQKAFVELLNKER